ncbi:MAG: fibrobacter succinogenes major paralogous domain-containing protein [Bacteroidales bacterium]|nr:fibrobacter succinogenes major paralogous domain-containing protein [Bacteroidales bacterium]
MVEGFLIALSQVIVSTGAGFLIGAGIRSKRKFSIKGSQEQFDRNKIALNDYSLKRNTGLEGKTFSKLPDTVADIAGNSYHLLAPGGQVWMAENLRMTHVGDGSGIPGATKNIDGNGYKYNWTAVTGSGGICPAGWHVPSMAEWTSLYNSLGGGYWAGYKLEKSFSGKGPAARWWSSTEHGADNAGALYLDNLTFGVMFTNAAKSSELSVRCIRDN